MGNLRKRLSKIASSDSYELKVLCVEKILKDNNVTLKAVEGLSSGHATDVVDYLETSETLTFENITQLVEKRIEETEENYPEMLN